MTERQRITIVGAVDVEEARRQARTLACDLGFGAVEAEMVVLAASELATNLLRYAYDGVVELGPVARPDGAGVEIVSVDRGPGIADVALALIDGYSTGGGLGHGLPGVRRLMDEFAIESGPSGTRITARKWTSDR